MTKNRGSIQPTASAPTAPQPPKRGEGARNELSRPTLDTFATAISGLTWRELTRISEHIAAEYDHLRMADKLDRDGVAQMLVEMADEILKQAELERAATTTGIDQ